MMELTNTELAARLRATLRDAKSWDDVPISAALLATAIARIEPTTAQIADRLIETTRQLMRRGAVDPDNDAILDAFVESFGGTHDQARERLEAFASHEVPA
jgi:hypothetical protein